MVAVVDSGGI